MTETINFLKKLQRIYLETTSRRPDIIVHSGTPGTFSDGTPLTDTRYRKRFFVEARNLMDQAVSHGQITDTTKKVMAQKFHEYLKYDISKRPNTLFEPTNDIAFANIEITPHDVEFASQTIRQFLDGTEFEIKD